MSSSSDDCSEIVTNFRSKITVSLPRATSKQESNNKKTKKSSTPGVKHYGSTTPLNKELEWQLEQLQKNLDELVEYTDSLERRSKVEQKRSLDLSRKLQTAEKINQILSKQLHDSNVKTNRSSAHQAYQPEVWERELCDEAKSTGGTSKILRTEMTQGQEQDQPQFDRLSSNIDELNSTLRDFKTSMADAIDGLSGLCKEMTTRKDSPSTKLLTNDRNNSKKKGNE